MWKTLDKSSLTAREEIVASIESWLRERYPSAAKKIPVFNRDRRDLEYIQWMYYEGLLGLDEADGLPAKCESEEIETALCVTFGFAIVDLYDLEWVYRVSNDDEIEFGLRVKDSISVLPLTASSLRQFPVKKSWSAGEEPSLDQYMFEINELLEKGIGVFKKVIDIAFPPRGNS